MSELELPVFTPGDKALSAEAPLWIAARKQMQYPRGKDQGLAAWCLIKVQSSSGESKKDDAHPCFSEGFPPVPVKLMANILRLEFVDMAELLRDNIEAHRRKAAQSESGSVTSRS